jgi:hypothetical protein
MHSLHVPRLDRWSRRKSVLVFLPACLAFWSFVIWGVKALLS